MGFFKKLFKKAKKVVKKVSKFGGNITKKLVAPAFKAIGGMKIPIISGLAKIGGNVAKGVGSVMKQIGSSKKPNVSYSDQYANQQQFESLGALQNQLYGVQGISSPAIGGLGMQTYSTASDNSINAGYNNGSNGSTNNPNRKGNSNVVKMGLTAGLAFLGFKAFS